MQPYLLPYLGYWQLIAAVDRFIILDDVNYIIRGWVNRNRILVRNKPCWLTLPLQKASRNKEIRDISLTPRSSWAPKMERVVSHSYADAPNREQGIDWFREITGATHENLADFLEEGIRAAVDRLEITTVIARASEHHPKNGLRGAERIRAICEAEGADTYVNLPGGRELYDTAFFQQSGVELRFLETQWEKIDLQGGREHLGLSIIHLLMWNDVKKVVSALGSWKSGL